MVASDADANDQLGFRVAISGDAAIAGAPSEETGGNDAGAAYIFERDAGGANNWGETKKLTASDAEPAALFGMSVAISGDVAVVGAPFEAVGGPFQEAVYVFERDEGGTGNWGEVKKLTASDADDYDYFGHSASISGDTIVVGAPREDTVDTDAGAAYVFQRDEGGADNWGEVRKLTVPAGSEDDNFGESISVNDHVVVVGSSRYPNTGAAYIFQRDQGGLENWGQVVELTASSGPVPDAFGAPVAASSDRVAVVDVLDEGGPGQGAVYIFERNEGGTDNWGEIKKPTNSDSGAGGVLGFSLDMNSEYLVAGNISANGGLGAAYAFQRDHGGTDNWGEVAKLTASAPFNFLEFAGVSVGVSGTTAIVGANLADITVLEQGAAYIFEMEEAADKPTSTPTDTPTVTLTPTITPSPTTSPTPTITPTVIAVGGVALDTLQLPPVGANETRPRGFRVSMWAAAAVGTASILFVAGVAIEHRRRQRD